MRKPICISCIVLFMLLVLTAQTPTAAEEEAGETPTAVEEEARERLIDPSVPFRNRKGPVRSRNQFPLNLPFLNFAPENHILLPAGGIVVDVLWSQTNTFAKTPGIIEGRQKGQRRRFRESDFDKVIADNPGEDQFYIDMDVTRISTLLSFGITDDALVDIDIPYLFIGGGDWDEPIEAFHDLAGTGQFGRDTLPLNRSTFALFLDGVKFYRSGFSYSGIGDIVVSFKYYLHRGQGFPPKVAVRAAVKLPTGDPDKLLGSGNPDYGLNFSATVLESANNFVLVNFGAVYPGDWELVPGLDPDPIYSAVVSWEFVPSGEPNVSYILQDHVQTATFASSTDTQLGDVSHETTFGLKWVSAEHTVWTLGLTENHTGTDNNVDLNLHVGVLRTWF